MNIFAYDNYKLWFKDKIKSMENQGRGQLIRVAQHLNTSPTIITQVFSGNRDLTPEQAISLGDFFVLSKLEQKYLVLLVNFSRAGSFKYKESLKEEIQDMKARSRDLSHRVDQNSIVTEEVKSVLYSNWYYLAIWSLIAIEGFHDLERISNRLGIDKKKVREVLTFLLKYSFIVEDENHHFKTGPTLIHLTSNSPQTPRNHQNWRLKAFTKYETTLNQNTFYTGVVTLSEADAQEIQESIRQFINQTVHTIKDSSSEKLYCLCLDWFEV